MNVIWTPIAGVAVVEPTIHRDGRGFFMESFNKAAYASALGEALEFEQDNHSKSAAGVLRGMHWQTGESAQGKLVRAVAGEAFDVAVDVRPSSPTFGRWFGTELTASNARQLWIGPGLAHGFLALGSGCEILYKATKPWSAQSERVLAWDDPDVAISWPRRPGSPPILSERDKAGIALRDLRAARG